VVWCHMVAGGVPGGPRMPYQQPSQQEISQIFMSEIYSSVLKVIILQGIFEGLNNVFRSSNF
jgi:hypothetical protein